MPIALCAAAFAASIVACFALEENRVGLAINAVDAGRYEMLVNAYVLATASGIPAAPTRARGRGVDVRLFADRHSPCDFEEGVGAVAAAGIPV